MVTYLLDFHENIRFSKTLSEYQEQPHPLLYLLIYLKKCMQHSQDIHGTFREYSYIQCTRNIPQGIFVYSIFPEHSSGNIPQNSQGTFSKYSGNISWECSTNIPRTYICPVFSSIYKLYSMKLIKCQQNRLLFNVFNSCVGKLLNNTSASSL